MGERDPIQECPVFTPNKREFADPLAYIRSIRQEGQKYGIVRIIPPDDWKPPLAINLEGLKFRTRIQQIDKLHNRSRDVTQSEFMRSLSEVVEEVILPEIDGQVLDCSFLYQEVCARKGFLEVSRKLLWAEIAKNYISNFKLFSHNTDKNLVRTLSNSLRNFYEKYLLLLERLDTKRKKPSNIGQSAAAAWEAPKWTPSKDEKREDESLSRVESVTGMGEVEALLTHQHKGKGFLYLVLWKGESTPTWEPRSKLSLQIRCDYEIFFPDEFGQCKDFYENNNLGVSDQEWREIRRQVKMYRTKWTRYHELLKKTYPDGTQIQPIDYAKIWKQASKSSSSAIATTTIATAAAAASNTKVKKEESVIDKKESPVESILAHSKKGTEVRYLVLWEGRTEPTWHSRQELPQSARCEYEAFYSDEFGTVSDDEDSLPLRDVRNMRGKERTEKWAKYCQLVKSTFENNELVEASAYAKLWRSLPVKSSPCTRRTRSSSTSSSSSSSSSPSETSSSSSSPPCETSSPSTPSTQLRRTSSRLSNPSPSTLAGATSSSSSTSSCFSSSSPPLISSSSLHKRAKMEPAAISGLANYEPTECLHCRGTDFKDKLLTCSWCYGMFHTFCLMPTSAPETLPPSRWICFGCRAANDGFGFDTGTNQTLTDYKKHADDFVQKRFPQGATEKQVIEEYWNIVEGRSPPAKVQYGSDIDTLEHGSGFPSSGIYARSGWNLCNLPKVANSLLKHLTNISGITVPWFYVGMMFSSFCWHNEDHYCYSINYVHTGAPKQWYGVPGLKSPEFEACAAKTLPDLFRIQPDLLYQMVTMLSPFTLREHGVPVYTTTQQAGQFVVTFPQAYHAGFNHGFNMAEAVNFAPADWLSYGVRGMEHYRRMHRAPVFPHDLLMCRLAADPCTGYDELAWLLAGLRRMVNEERTSRLALYAEGVRTGIRWDEAIDRETGPSVANAELRKGKMMKGGRETLHHLVECCLCRHALWVSSIRCGRCSSDRITCLRHGHLLCACPAKEKQLLFRYSTEELENLVTQVTTNLHKHEEQTKSSYAKRKLADQPDSAVGNIVMENKLILESLPLLEEEDCKRNINFQHSWHSCIEEWVAEAQRALNPGKKKVLNKLMVQELLASASELNWGDHSADVRKYEEELRGYEVLLNNLNSLCQDKCSLKDALIKCGYSSLSSLNDFISEVSNSPILCDSSHMKTLEVLSSLYQTACTIDTKLRSCTEAQNDGESSNVVQADSAPVSLAQLFSLHDEATTSTVTLPSTSKLGVFLKAVNQWIEKVNEIINSQSSTAPPRYEVACGLLRQGSTWEFVKDVQVLQAKLKALIEQTDAHTLAMRTRFGCVLEPTENATTVSIVQYSALKAAAQSSAVLRTRESIQLDKILAGFDQWALDAGPKLDAAAQNLASFSVAQLTKFLDQLPNGLEGVPNQIGMKELVRARRWYDDMLVLSTEEELASKRSLIKTAQEALSFDALKPTSAELHDLVSRGRAIVADQPVLTEWLSLFKSYVDKQAKRETKAVEMATGLAAVLSLSKPKLKSLKWWLQEVETFPVRLVAYSDLRIAVHAVDGWATRAETLLNEALRISIDGAKQILDESRNLPVDIAGHPTLVRLETYEHEARDLVHHVQAYLEKTTADLSPLQAFLVREQPKQLLARVREQNIQAKTLLSRVSALRLTADCVRSLRAFAWRLQVRLEISNFTSLTALEAFIAEKNDTPSVQHDCALLTELLDKARVWNTTAQKAVDTNFKAILYDDVIRLLEDSELLPFVLPIESALESKLKNVRKWIHKVNSYLEPRDNAPFELAQLRELQEKGAALQLALPELERLERVIATVESYEKELDALFPRPSVLSLKAQLTHILEGDKTEMHCLCFEDKPGSTMLCCDECEKWFHHKCVRVKVNAIGKTDHYSCPLCCEKQSVPYPFASCSFQSSFPPLHKLQDLLTEFRVFPVVARFALFLQAQDVYSLAVNFRKQVRTVLSVDPGLPTLAEALAELAIQAKRIGVCHTESKLIAARIWALNVKKLLAPHSQTQLDVLQELLRVAPTKDDLLMPGLPGEDDENHAWIEISDMLVRYVAWGHLYARGICSNDPAIAAPTLALFNEKTLGAVKIGPSLPPLQVPATSIEVTKRKRKKESSDESAEEEAVEASKRKSSSKKSGKQVKRKSQSSTLKAEKLYCVCQTPYANDFMVACDKCDEWYHPACIGKTKAQVERVENFICESCLKV